MADLSYHRLYTAFRKHDDYDVVFRSALEAVADKMDFSWVKSCLAFGPGSGEREMEFVRRLMPNLRSFIAVEQDYESIEALRTNFEEGRLLGVELSVVETCLESFSGVDSAVDAVLFISMLCNIHTTNRRALFQQLKRRYMNSVGVVIVAENSRTTPSGYLMIMERLGKMRDDYELMEKEMLEAGFRVVLSRISRTSPVQTTTLLSLSSY